MQFQHHRFACWQACALAALLLLIPAAGRAATIGSIQANNTSIAQYDRYELSFNLSGVSPSDYNPFRPETTGDTLSPAGIDVWANVTTPSGKTIRVDGFWGPDYEYLGMLTKSGQTDRDRYAPVSAPHWAIRFAPSELGTHSIQVFAKDQNGTANSSVYTFNCVSGKSSGFVKIASDGQRFARSNGDPFIPFGSQMAKYPFTVEDFTDQMQANGMNFVRYWMVNLDTRDIFRGLSYPNWASTSYDTTTYRSGKRSGKLTVTGTGTVADESFIGCRPSRYYRAYCYFKTSSDFNGKVAVNINEQNGYSGTAASHKGNSVGAGASWVKSEVIFQSRSDAECLHFKPQVLSGTVGTIWIDDCGLYECDAAGNPVIDCNMVINPSFEEWTPAQLGLLPLARFEHLLDVCDSKGITVQGCIFDYRLWNTTSPTGFYTKYFGGTFFTPGSDAEAQEKRVLRYIIARFASYRSLFAWELTNEVSPDYSTNEYQWLSDMSSYIHAADPYGHIVTASFWHSPADARYDQLKTLDSNSVHYYMNTEERTGGQGVPTWWNLSTGMSVDRTSSNAHTGSSSLKIVANGSSIGRNYEVFVKPGRSYRLQYWIKPQGVSGKAGMSMNFYRTDGSAEGSTQTRSSTGSSGYVQQTINFTTPTDCNHLVIRPFMTGSAGTAWIDDIQVTDTSTGVNALYNGEFECANFGDDEFEWAAYNIHRTRQEFESGPNGTKKPWSSGEFALLGDNGGLSYWIRPNDTTKPRHDDTGIHLHNALWAECVASSAMYSATAWGPQDYLMQYNPSLLWLWKGITTFTKNLPFYTKGTPVSTDTTFGEIKAVSSNPQIRLLGQKSGNSAYVWIQNRQYSWSWIVRDDLAVTPASADITIPSFAAGTYTVDWYNTVTGQLVLSDTETVPSSGVLTLSVSSLSQDVAAVIKQSNVVVQPNVQVVIAADRSNAMPGDTVTYTVSFTNTGNGPANNVDVCFPVPADSTYITGSAGTDGTYDSATNSVHWKFASLSAGASGKRTAQVRLN